ITSVVEAHERGQISFSPELKSLTSAITGPLLGVKLPHWTRATMLQFDPMRWRFNRLLSAEHVVKPVGDPAVHRRAVHNFAMAAGALSRPEPNELLRAPQSFEQILRAGRQRIVFGMGDERWTADELGSVLERERRDAAQKLAEAFHAVHPKTAL